MNSHILRMIILLPLFTVTLYHGAYGQEVGNLTSQPAPTEWIKIISPLTGEKVVAGQEVEMAGESSDDTSKACLVSVIVNNVEPYQNAFAMGPAGDDDFSRWTFAIRENYTGLIEGENKITAKLSCPTPLATRWYSVFVTGVSATEVTNTTKPLTVTPQSNLDSTETNLTLPTQHPEEPSGIPLPTTFTNITTSPENNNQSLHVSINAQENPVSRGDNQSITIEVIDSNSKAVPGANINGELKYPGGNYEKDFSGVTDIDGSFLYSWTIGENGDLGELVIEIEVTSLGYDSQSVMSSFELIDPSDSSVIVNSATDLKDQSISTQKDGFDLVAAGDYGCNAVTEEIVNKMKDKNPDLVLAIGDLSEDKNPECFFDLFSKLDDDGKLKVTLGEHDTDSNSQEDSSSRFSQYVSHFELAETFYSFDYQNVHFLAMSTGKPELIPTGIDSPQYSFVVNDLAKASNNEEIDWIIVYGYRPFYSSPTVHPGPMSLRDVYHPLFEKYGVDLVITAHNHNYQRTFPLKLNAVSQSNPIVTDNDNSSYVNPGAPIFVTVGTAGQELYDLLDQNSFVATQFKRNGFLDIHISNDGTKLTGTFYDSTNGNDGDYFTINKL